MEGDRRVNTRQKRIMDAIQRYGRRSAGGSKTTRPVGTMKPTGPGATSKESPALDRLCEVSPASTRHVPGPVQSVRARPFRTVSFNTAVYGQPLK